MKLPLYVCALYRLNHLTPRALARTWPKARLRCDLHLVCLLVTLGLLGVLLSVTVVPGVFTIDEANYLTTTLSLRAGGFTVPGTEDLPPSLELLYFDAALRSRGRSMTPVASTAPPLYAFLSLPFSYLGWRGLVGLNTLAFLLAAAVVFLYAKDFSQKPSTPWIAICVFTAGSYLVEYAQGAWPHMLAGSLCIVALYLATRARSREILSHALVAGLIAGLATGVRYQNIVVAGGIGLGFLAWNRRRLALVAAYGMGLVVPLAVCSVINHSRIGSWNPISKGPGYLRIRAGQFYTDESIAPPDSERAPNMARSIPTHETHETAWLPVSSLGAWALAPSIIFADGMSHTGNKGTFLRFRDLFQESFLVLATRVVDFSLHPPLPEGLQVPHAYAQKDPVSGAVTIGTASKKAWLQSCPWLVVPMLVLVGAWVDRGVRDSRQRELRAFSLIVISVLAMFSLAGFSRFDGLCFNQRYFIELMPLMAVALAWSMEDIPPKATPFGLGIALSVAALGVTFTGQPPVKYVAVMKIPLVLSFFTAIAWVATRRFRASATALSVALGMSLMWAVGAHVFEDLPASRQWRRANLQRKEQVEPVLPVPSALFAHWGGKDAFAPIQLTRDLLILDTWADNGDTAPQLIQAFLERGRRVFVCLNGLPPSVFHAMSAGFVVRGIAAFPTDAPIEPIRLVELSMRP